MPAKMTANRKYIELSKPDPKAKTVFNRKKVILYGFFRIEQHLNVENLFSIIDEVTNRETGETKEVRIGSRTTLTGAREFCDWYVYNYYTVIPLRLPAIPKSNTWKWKGK